VVFRRVLLLPATTKTQTKKKKKKKVVLDVVADSVPAVSNTLGLAQLLGSQILGIVCLGDVFLA